MSGGANHAAFERQLKKIYDCLNIGCNKKAVQEVDRLTKNFRDLTVFKSLKSLALIRMYKRRQAFEILSEINLDDDLDETTLHTMTSCYKESVDVGKIVDLYEAAIKRKPNDPEIMSHLFMAYARVFNFKRQKEIALQMYKNFDKRKRLHSFWAIMSLVMQSQEAKKSNSESAANDRKVCLSLAEKMCERMMDDERTQEEIELYLMILRKQDKHEEEYRFLTGPICLRIIDHLSWFNRRRAYLCLELKMYSRAFKHYFPTLIQEYPDQTEYYQGLYKSAFLLDTEAPSQQQPVAVNDHQQNSTIAQSSGTPVKSASALAECYEIVEKQCQLAVEPVESSRDSQKGKNQTVSSKNLSRTSSLNPNRRRLLRGPFIARVELYHLILSNENTLPKNVYELCKNQFSSRFPTLNSLLLDFFQSFSKKMICYYDMDYMINQYNLSSEDRRDLIQTINIWLNEVKQNQVDQINLYDVFHIQLNYNMLRDSIISYDTPRSMKEKLDLVKQYVDLYDTNRSLGKNSNKTEFLPVDQYCLLAINAIMFNSSNLNEKSLSKFELTDSIIITLIVMAESAIVNSPSNHQLKLILIKLYSFIGASKQSSEVLLSLDIKHFQIDTLGHLLNPVLYNTGNYSLSRESLETCLEFYALGIRECFEGLTTSYRDGRFSKIEEITGVLRRLSDSLNAIQCILLKGIVANLSVSNIDELLSACQSFDPFRSLERMFRSPDNADTLKDNRDFKVLKSLNFETNKLVEKRQEETFQDEQLWLRLRYYLIRSAYIQTEQFCRVQKDSDRKDTSATNRDELEFGFKQVEDLMPKIEKIASESRDMRYSYLEPEASPIRWGHIMLEPLVSLLKPIVFCSNPAKLTQEDLDSYNHHLEIIVNDLEQQMSSINSFITLKRALMSLTISLEFISLSVTSLTSFHQIEINSANNISNAQSIGNTTKASSSSQNVQVPASKTKFVHNQMINKTEAQLTKLSNLVKGVDPKALIMNKISKLEESILSDSNQRSNSDTKALAPLQLLMGDEATHTLFPKIREKILDSYSESIKEIESTCRRKIKLLRGKT